MGTPAATTRGMKETEMQFIGNTMLEVLSHIKSYKLPQTKEERIPYLKAFRDAMDGDSKLSRLKKEVENMASGFAIP